MNKFELQADCEQSLKAILEPLEGEVFQKTVVDPEATLWSDHMARMAALAQSEFRSFLESKVREIGMSGAPEKSFSLLWKREFNDRLWRLRKRLSHHAFPFSEKGETIRHVARLIIGKVSDCHSMPEVEVVSRVYLMDWFHATRTGRTLTGMQWFMGEGHLGQATLISPEWDLLKINDSNAIVTIGEPNRQAQNISITGTVAQSERALRDSLNQDEWDAIDLILIKTKRGSAPWKQTFPVKVHQEHKTDFNRLDLELFATWFAKSKVFNPSSHKPQVVDLLNAS